MDGQHRVFWQAISRWQWVVLTALFACLCPPLAWAATPVTNPDALLEQAWDMQVMDHSRSLQLLAKLNQSAASLTQDQQWRLRLLNAWEAKYEGDYSRSELLLKDIALHSGNQQLADRSYAMLLSQYGITRRYADAFDLADRLALQMNRVKDAKVRYSLLLNLSQTMGLAGQADLAVRYVRMAMNVDPTPENKCYAEAVLVDVLSSNQNIKFDSPEFQQAFEACPMAAEPLYNIGISVNLASLYAHGGKPHKALDLLDKIRPNVNGSGYTLYKLMVLNVQALALASLGKDGAARKAALAVVAAGSSGDFDTWLKDAYEVLYRIEKKQGNAAAALDYYEKYTALDKAYLSDVNARALAYETVQQHVLAQRLETEQLARQNASLRLQQQLAAKTAEANRLYIALLALALGFGVFVMVRLKRSQLRYRRLSRLDGLTELLNRQHFMGDAELVLQRLHKRGGETCLAYLDLDHFKRINDTHGHAAADAVLRDVVAVCRQQLRSLDLFGRLGGEEFGILLVDTSREQAWAIAGRIRQAVAASPVAFGEDRIAVSVSIGLACADSSGHDLQRLCMDADAALYLAKDSGRNCVVADGGGAGLNQRTPTSSTSKISTASGGMSSPSPRLP